jgi:hypothetical protein
MNSGICTVINGKLLIKKLKGNLRHDEKLFNGMCIEGALQLLRKKAKGEHTAG